MDKSLKEYEIPREISMLDIAEKSRIFPTNNINNLKNLRITDIALFSTTPPDQSEFICQLLIKIYGINNLNKMTITDANGCIGGNSYCFIKFLKMVNFVEISDLHMKIFKYNLNILYPKCKNIQFYTDNYANNGVYDKIQQDIIFLDPPWGGPEYYKKKTLDLYYTTSNGNQISVSDLIKNHLKSLARTIIMKVPYNFNIEKLMENSEFKYTKVIKILKKSNAILYYIIVLSHDTPVQSLPNEKQFQALGYKYMHWKYI
jgi:16S rRNA G966 N2-methylase RsmD